jgi:nitroreductase / dihydropteridine reductase
MSFISQLNWRYATKSFDSSKKVSSENLAKILEAIRLAPTSFGLQTFHIVHVANSELRDQLKALAWNQPQITEASDLLVFCARNDVKQRIEDYFNLVTGGDENIKTAMSSYKEMMTGFEANLPEEYKTPWATRQAYIVLGFAMAACAELEIDSCPMEGFDPAGFKTALNLPENIVPVVCLPIGYRSSNDVVRPKVRFDLSDLVSEQ